MIQIVCDPHFADRPPAVRNEDYLTDIVRKFVEVGKISESCLLTAIAGDLFHTKNEKLVSHGLNIVLMRLLRRIRNPFLVLGNHDILGAETKSVLYQPVGVLIESGLVKRLDLNGVIVGGVQIVGLDYNESFEQGTLVHELPPLPTTAKKRLLVIHSSMGGQQWKNLRGHYDYVVAGHEHQGIPRPGDKFDNPGAISRVRDDPWEATRQISSLILDKDLRPKRVVLTTQRPWDKVSVERTVSAGRKERRETMKLRFEEFMEALQAGASKVDVEEILEGLRPPVAARVREYIGQT